jgi:hypothetical protein
MFEKINEILMAVCLILIFIILGFKEQIAYFSDRLKYKKIKDDGQLKAQEAFNYEIASIEKLSDEKLIEYTARFMGISLVDAGLTYNPILDLQNAYEVLARLSLKYDVRINDYYSKGYFILTYTDNNELFQDELRQYEYVVNLVHDKGANSPILNRALCVLACTIFRKIELDKPIVG